MTAALLDDPVDTAVTGSILEIFASRQGEGVCVGDAQTFVRFGGCNLACDYCDTPESIPAHSGKSWTLPQVAARIDALDGGRAGSVVSLTGGEPLVQISFLERCIPALRSTGRRIYLETNGALPEALERVVDGCDWIAMDLKPPSAVRQDLWEAHRWFLKIGESKIFVKLILTDSTREEELRRALELIASVSPRTPLILQPATPHGRAGTIPLPRLASWWNLAARRLTDVRILPQVHRLWDIP